METTGNILLDEKQGRWIQKKVNNVLHQMEAGGASQVNRQHPIVQWDRLPLGGISFYATIWYLLHRL